MRQTLPILTVKFRIHTLPKRQDLPHKASDWATLHRFSSGQAHVQNSLSLPLGGGVAISSRVLGSSVPAVPILLVGEKLLRRAHL